MAMQAQMSPWRREGSTILPATMVLGPDRPADGRERWLVALIAVGVIAMLVAETVRDFRPAKLSALVMVLSLGPLVLIHEAGHALAGHIAGWRVCRIVVGPGRSLLRLHVGGVPVDVHWEAKQAIAPGKAWVRRMQM